MRTLHLTNPLMHGTDVRSAQVQLNKHGYLSKADIDSVFGTHTGHSCEIAKFKLGYASADIKPTYGDQLDGLLKGTITLPKKFKERQHARVGEPFEQFEETALRSKIVSIALWGIHNTHAIRYQQRRPIDGINHPYELPLYTDCSGWVTLCYKWAGAPDPNGRNFDGLGYTGTLLSYMRPIMQSQVKIGDVVVWSRFPGHHTAIVIGGPLNDPLLCSHGKESDPIAIRFSQESKFQSSYHIWLRLPQWA